MGVFLQPHRARGRNEVQVRHLRAWSLAAYGARGHAGHVCGWLWIVRYEPGCGEDVLSDLGARRGIREGFVVFYFGV
jgi:hypothetical protein